MKLKYYKVIQIFVGAAILITAFILASMTDFEEELAQQERYCENVRNGVWPDYRKNYEEMCIE